MNNKKRNFWISVFQRNGQRFLCSSCGYAGELNSFSLAIQPDSREIRFLCPSCQSDLVFDPESEAMRPGHGEMVHPEVSLSRRLQRTRMLQALLVGCGLAVVVLVFVYAQFARLGTRMADLDANLKNLSGRQSQGTGLGGEVDLAFPGFQEVGAGYAILPRSAVRESSGVRIKGVVVNEKAMTVDAKFRLTQAGHAQTFLVENLASGTGETFDVLLPGATDTTGRVMVEVVKTNLSLE